MTQEAKTSASARLPPKRRDPRKQLSTRKHPIVFYDVRYDEFRPISQDLVDNLMATSQAYGRLRKELSEMLSGKATPIGGLKTKVPTTRLHLAILGLMQSIQLDLLANLKPTQQDPAP